MSPLLVRLEQQIALATDPALRAELLAKKAAALARHGSHDDARAIIGELRKVFGDGRSGRATVWMMLAEGLIYRYSELSSKALDRITRAQVLSIAMGYREAIATVSAWKALIELDLLAIDLIAGTLATSIESADSFNHDAWTRIALNIFCLATLSGDSKLAQTWFMRARQHAVENGDQAGIEALQYNKVAFQLARMRMLVAHGIELGDETKLVRREYSSAHSLRELTNVTALEGYLYLCDARLSVLEGDYAIALDKFARVRGKTPFTASNFTADLERLEFAYCAAMSGNVEEALKQFVEIRVETLVDLVIDEQIFAAWILERLAILDDRFGDRSIAQRRLDELRLLFGRTMNSLSEWLSALPPPPPWITKREPSA